MDEARTRVGEYALLHLADVAGFAGDLAHEIVEDETSVALVPYDPEHRRGLFMDKIVARLDYCSSGMADLRAAGFLPGRENEGVLGMGPGEIGQQTGT